MSAGDFFGDIVDDIKGFFDSDIGLAKNTASDVQGLLQNPHDTDLQKKFASEVDQIRTEAAKDGSFDYYNKMNREFNKLEEKGFPSISMMGDGGIVAMPKRDPSTAAAEGTLKIEDSHDTNFNVTSEVVDHSERGLYGWRKV